MVRDGLTALPCRRKSRQSRSIRRGVWLCQAHARSPMHPALQLIAVVHGTSVKRGLLCSTEAARLAGRRCIRHMGTCLHCIPLPMTTHTADASQPQRSAVHQWHVKTCGQADKRASAMLAMLRKRRLHSTHICQRMCMCYAPCEGRFAPAASSV